MNKNLKENKDKRTGEENISNEGYKMKIVEYKDCHNIIVEFQDEHKVKIHTTYCNFKKGSVKNPYHPNVYNIGYIGEGKYKSRDNKKEAKVYKYWKGMLKRCYDPYYINKEPTYIDCYVCNEWHNFQNFAEWFYKNYYEIEGDRMHLDKDILCKGNKIYSPQTCIIVPQRINSLFLKMQNCRGEYPIGVCKHPINNVLLVCCGILDENKKFKRERLGQFPLDRPFQAFYTYKIFKEKYIKQVADEYRGLIPIELYNAMYKYEVEIND